jgi:hypothetical protein
MREVEVAAGRSYTAGPTLVLVGLVSSGCAMGIGVVEPGSKRTSHQAVSNFTLIDSTGTGDQTVNTYKVDTTEVNQSTPAGFGGTMVGVHAGANTSSVAGQGGSGWVLDAFWEMLGGRGRWAFGARVGYMLRKGDDVDLNGDGTGDVSTGYGGLPLTLHAYYGLSPTLSTHLGIGGDMFTFGESSSRSLRVMSGLRFALSSNDDGATLLVIDVDHLRSTRDEGAYRSFGVIGGLALVK